jgi:hypothetical protein
MPGRAVERRFFSKDQPQTLQFAVILMYWNAGLAVISGILGLYFGPIALVSLLAYVAGAFGVANERRWGYRVALVAAFLPFVLVAISLIGGTHFHVGVGVLTFLFDLALVALLVHPMSREYEKVWFR